MRKGFASILLVILLILIVIVACGAYYFGIKSSSSTSKATESLPNLTSAETAAWQTYTDTILSFTIKYPRDWEVYLVDSDPGAPVYRPPNADEGKMLNGRGVELVFQKIGPTAPIPPIRLGIAKITPPYDYAYKEKELSNNKIVLPVITKIKIEGIEALRDRETYRNELVRSFVMFQKDDYLYSLATTKSVYEDTLNKMISTFKFSN